MSLNVRPSGNIGFTVQGLNEIVLSLDSMQREIPTVRAAVLNEAARFLVNEAKRNVHVVSGDLKNSISIESATTTADHVIVSAKTRYAAIENEREGVKRQTPKSKGPYGTHNYFTKAVIALQGIYATRIKVNFDQLWARHRTR